MTSTMFADVMKAVASIGSTSSAPGSRRSQARTQDESSSAGFTVRTVLPLDVQPGTRQRTTDHEAHEPLVNGRAPAHARVSRGSADLLRRRGLADPRPGKSQRRAWLPQEESDDDGSRGGPSRPAEHQRTVSSSHDYCCRGMARQSWEILRSCCRDLCRAPRRRTSPRAPQPEVSPQRR
jgi:hypothetical protein